jgi:hypothetical protein
MCWTLSVCLHFNRQPNMHIHQDLMPSLRLRHLVAHRRWFLLTNPRMPFICMDARTPTRTHARINSNTHTHTHTHTHTSTEHLTIHASIHVWAHTNRHKHTQNRYTGLTPSHTTNLPVRRANCASTSAAMVGYALPMCGAPLA